MMEKAVNVDGLERLPALAEVCARKTLLGGMLRAVLAHPDNTSRDDLLDEMYPGGDDPEGNIVPRIACELRKLLRAHGMALLAIHGTGGYRLAPLELAKFRACERRDAAARRGDFKAAFQGRSRDIYDCLDRARNRYVSRDFLHSNLAPDATLDNITVVITKMRHTLALGGWTIVHVAELGYRLTPLDARALQQRLQDRLGAKALPAPALKQPAHIEPRRAA